MEAPQHKVKHAIKCQHFFVVECRCGWSSALHDTASAANDAYATHKRGLQSADHLPAFAAQGTQEVLL